MSIAMIPTYIQYRKICEGGHTSLPKHTPTITEYCEVYGLSERLVRKEYKNNRRNGGKLK